MDSHVLRHSPAATALPRWLVVGFVSGFIAVLIFHQGAAAFLHALQWTPRAPYSMAAVAPLGVPQVLSLAFWGGVWGVLLAFVLARLDGAMLVLAATIFGAILPTVIAWFVVAPLKHIVMPHTPSNVILGLTVNGAWGLGTALFFRLFARSH